MIAAQYVETNCVFKHDGKDYEAGGAAIGDKYLIAYLGKDGVLTSWHGEPLGKYKIVSTWKIQSCYSSTMSSVRITLTDGRKYHGRGFGVGMSIRAKRCA